MEALTLVRLPLNNNYLFVRPLSLFQIKLSYLGVNLLTEVNSYSRFILVNY